MQQTPPVVVVRDEAEIVAVANDTEYGLVAAIQIGSDRIGSVKRGCHVAEQPDTGIVHINDRTLNDDTFAPFGATGASGNGARFSTQSSWGEFTTWQWVTSRSEGHPFPF